jgi:serine/threonine protein phosphatase PrpC
MSLFANKSSNFLSKSKDIIEKKEYQIKTNRKYKRSLNPKVNNFLKYCKQKSNIIENKNNLFPKLEKENKKSKNHKSINLKNSLIRNNIIKPSSQKIKLGKNSRNFFINMNSINSTNQLSTQKEFSNSLYNNTINNALNIKQNNIKIKRYFLRDISHEDKNDNKSFNTFLFKEKIIPKNKIFKYHSDKKSNNKLFNKYVHKNQNPVKLFLVKNYFSALDENISKPSKKVLVNENKETKKYYTEIKDYYCKSEAGTDIFGKAKINQDSYLHLSNIYNLNNYSVFAIFDGHGMNGHLTSNFTKKYFQNYFVNIDNNSNNPLNVHDEYEIYKKISNKENIQEQIKLIEKFLLEQSFSIQYSGTTSIIIIYIENKIICYNIGDSRAVYINKDYKCIQISKDHKPEMPNEKTRIEENGGIVKKDYLNSGIYRVWSKNGHYPGLAMSRSIGDYVAKSLGVINEPDYYEIDIIENNVCAVIIGSDGLWDALNNKQIEMIAEEYIIKDDCIACVNALIDNARKVYKKRNISCDDISVIVIFIDIKK